MAKKNNKSTPYYFISYAHSDIDIVMPVINYLIRKGYNVWYDKHIESGSDWRNELCAAISGCKAVIPMLSTAFNNSTWCRQEIDYSFDSGKPIYPIFIQNCNLAPALKFQISGKQAIMKTQLSSVAFYKELLKIVGEPNIATASKATKSAETAPKVSPEASNLAKFNRALAYVNTGNAIKGYAILKELSDIGYHNATSELADMHFSGNGAERDESKSYELHKKAADNKVVRSIVSIANMHIKGIGILRKDERRGVEYLAEACKLGDVDSCLRLGASYAQGILTKRDDKLSVYYYTLAANYGSPEGQFHVGRAYFEGKGVKRDYSVAYKYLIKSAEQGYSDSIYLTAFCLHKGKGCTANDTLAISYLSKLSGKNNIKADILLGAIYESNNMRRDAFRCYNIARKSGDITAMLKYADCLYNGYGTPRDYAGAYEIYNLLSSQKNEKALLMTAVCRFYGYGCSVNHVSAVDMLNELISTSPTNAKAKCYLAAMYNDITYFKCSTKRAEQLYQDAIKLGSKNAEFEFALMHHRGDATNSSPTRAYELFSSSASKDNPDAYYYLGKCHFYGIGCTHDYKKAVELLELALFNDCKKAANMLGLCYYYGNGVIMNLTKAYKYFTIGNKAEYAPAIHNHAIATLLGVGCTADPTSALAALTKHQNLSAEIKYSLAVCYRKGIVVKPDEERANMLINSSADSGYPPALNAMELLHNLGGKNIRKSSLKANYYKKQIKKSTYLSQCIMIPDNFKL